MGDTLLTAVMRGLWQGVSQPIRLCILPGVWPSQGATSPPSEQPLILHSSHGKVSRRLPPCQG